MNGATLRQCPYVGLMPYGEEDWEYFFGRETETDLIIANLTAARLTLLYGASGVGKSSALRAGVAHKLREQARRNRERSAPPEFALAIFNAWRDDPLAGLTRAICDAVGVALGRDMGAPPDRSTLADACPRWAEEVGGDLFVVLDQFEEYFLYHGREDGEGSFAVEFPRLVNREGLRVNFLVAIRDDAVARLDRFKGRIPRLFDNYLRLHHLDLEAAARAIRAPLARYNERHPGEAVVIEEALVQEVLRQTRTDQPRPGTLPVAAPDPAEPDAQIEAPYLQIVMTRLWDEERASGSHVLRLQTFVDKLGGADQIVRTHLDREMDKLDPAEQDVAAEAFRYLVTRTGSKIALSVDDLGGYAELPPATLATVLEKLSSGEKRILRPLPMPDHPDVVRYEIFHDVLAQAITAWRRRHESVTEQQALLRQVEESKREELKAIEDRRVRERARYFKLGLVAAVIVLVVLVGALWSAQQEANNARFALQQAEAAAKRESELAKAAIEARAAPVAPPPVVSQAAPAPSEGNGRWSGKADLRTAALELREAFLSGDTDVAETTARRLNLLNENVTFRAERVPQNYSIAQGQVYAYTMWPVPTSVPGGLRTLSAVTYKMNHPTFIKSKLLVGDPAQAFRATYYGWGSLSRVPVLLEYADAARPPELAMFPMSENVVTVSRGSRS